MQPRTVPELIDGVVAAHATDTAYSVKRDGGWRGLTWAEYRESVRRVSRALIALGVGHGEKVGILAATRLEWAQCDMGTSSCGAVTVGIYPSNLARDCAFIIGHAEAVVVIVEDEGQLEKIRAVRDELPTLREVILIDGAPRDGEPVIGWDEFLARGDSVDPATLEARTAAIEPDDVATLVYTSGTTGEPKGAMLSHRNLIFTSGSVGQKLYTATGFETLIFLPLAHVFARLMIYCALTAGNSTAFAESLTTVPQNLLEVRPHYIASVPRIYEKVHERVMAAVEHASPFRRRLFHWALRVGERAAAARREGRRLGLGARVAHAIADRLALRKIRNAFGGRLIWAVSGAAPLNPALGYFFDACGVTILEGIGMTENTSFANVNELGDNRIGTVGRTGPGIEMKLAEDGEVLYRGDNVMLGYYKNPEATAETIDEDGWLHTGDIGTIDDDGFLRITDRKKDLIITAGGKNIAPQRIERIMRTSPFVSHVMAYGDRRKYISALITIEETNVRAWAERNGVSAASYAELSQHPKVRELIEAEVAARNHELASFESIKRFQILPEDFSIETGELTPTLKLKRKVVVDRLHQVLDDMYDD